MLRRIDDIALTLPKPIDPAALALPPTEPLDLTELLRSEAAG
ncbi:hypothetical protein [Microbacterium gorillae]|nr:hypothetical protein [Microbacterium gorillae]